MCKLQSVLRIAKVMKREGENEWVYENARGSWNWKEKYFHGRDFFDDEEIFWEGRIYWRKENSKGACQ